MRQMTRALLPLLVVSITATSAAAQSIFTDTPSKASHKNAGPAVRSRNVHVAPGLLLRSTRISLDLFDGVSVNARRSRLFSPRKNSIVWTGTLEAPDAGHVTLSVVDGMVSGTVFAFGRTFEVLPWADGTAEVRELSPSEFPSDDPGFDAAQSSAMSGGTTVQAAADTTTEMDVMVVWTPKARNAAGGTVAAIQSLVDTAVANANAAYANSGVSAHLRLVYSGEVNYTEVAGDITGDLNHLTNGDGVFGNVHSLRSQYGADVVTLLGSGYTSGSAACGIGWLMQSVSTSFASSAYNVVDQSCAAGNLSYAHEVGHNQGLQHDPANAGSSPSFSYAYGYQASSGAFRTVMSYGGAPRVPYFSNPNMLYNSQPTGTASQNNARALTGTVATVAAFMGGGSTITPSACAYSVSPTTLSFGNTGGTLTVSVSTSAGCSWSVEEALPWVTVNTVTGSGSGSVAVTVPPNAGTTALSGSLTVAGVKVSVSEKAPKMVGKGRK